jgi:hypothetical protein
MTWLGVVDHQYQAYLLDLKPPPPTPCTDEMWEW